VNLLINNKYIFFIDFDYDLLKDISGEVGGRASSSRRL